MTSRDRDFGRKYGSGNSKRKKYKKRIEVETQLRGALTKFLKTDKVADDKEQSTKEAEDDAAIAGPSNQSDTHLENTEMMDLDYLESPYSSPVHLPLEDNEEDSSLHEETNALPMNLTVSDPYLWPKQISDLELTSIVQNGVVRVSNISYPTNESGRHFSDTHYIKTLVNGEQQDRRWLLYSQSKDAVYCFACRLFSPPSIKNSALGSIDGMSD